MFDCVAGRGIYLSPSENGGASLSAAERLSELDGTAAFPTIALNGREAIIGWEAGGQIVAIRRARANGGPARTIKRDRHHETD